VLSEPGADIKTPEFLEKLVHGLIFSGMAMEIAGSSRPCSGAGHKISHSIDRLGLAPQALHGEQVALGSLVASVLHNEGWEKRRDFIKRIGLPAKCSDIDITPDDFLKALESASSMRPDRYTILEKLSLDKAGYRRILAPTGILEE